MKSLSYFVVGLLLLSGFAAISIGNEADEKQETVSLSFLEPDVVEGKTFVELEVEGTNNHIFYAGKPMLPVYTETLILPFGAKINDITCETQEVNSMVLSEKIMPAPQPQVKSVTVSSAKTVMDEMVYNSEELFPNDWYSYHVGVGLDKNMEHKTLVTINAYPVRYSSGTDTVYYSENIDLKITYEDPNGDPFPANSAYDLVIIAPEEFSSDLQNLVDHKISVGLSTILKTTEDIYDEYDYRDAPEEIKYFIKDALEDWDVKYVLLVGGLKSLIYAKPKDDRNHGASGWHLPVRYSNFLWDGDPNYNFTGDEPGYLCDLYFADVYKEGGVFDDWDSNGNGIFAEWAGDIRDALDLYPDVALGRLACRNTREVKAVVNKIINYETTADPSWFKKILAVSGDGFLDQEDLNIEWDVNDLPDGEYTIYAQSKNPDGIKGPIDELHVTLDRTVETSLSFNHDDHLKPGYKNYPAPPIAEIVSVSDGDILGNTDFTYIPGNGEAYCNDLYWWANMSYVDGVLIIRGKSYDPRPYGNLTNIKVWIENPNSETIFTAYRNDTETYYEGEWGTGEKLLRGRGGGLYYMPDDFEKEIVWTSNGKWVDQSDVIEAFSKGYGFVYFSGHGSPGWWGNHYPGIPGNRGPGSVAGLVVTQVSPFFPFIDFPVFPMNKLSNTNKPPVVCVGGCHNSMFNVSLILTFLDLYLHLSMHTYGTPIPECWGWYLVKLPKTGAIATMGNTGYGWGSEGDVCTIGTGDVWINTEFFRQCGEENQQILGNAYSQAIASYITNHKTLELDYWRHDYGWDGIDEKTVQQWVLLGDPSLMMGGYQEQSELTIKVIGTCNHSDGKPNEEIKLEVLAENKPISYDWDLDGDGLYDDATGETIQEYYESPGVYWVEVKATYTDKEITYKTIVSIEKDQVPNKPNKPSGTSSIKVGREYTYTTYSSDPYNDELYYLFNWGDGKFDVVGPIASGEEASAKHTWIEKGSFEVKVNAFDSYGQWSKWSEPLSVTMPRNRAMQTAFLNFLENFFEKFPNAFPILRQLLGL